MGSCLDELELGMMLIQYIYNILELTVSEEVTFWIQDLP